MQGKWHSAVQSPGPTPDGGGDRWGDLRPRVISGVVLVAAAVVLALSTGAVFAFLVSAFIAVTFWELARMTTGTTLPGGPEARHRHRLFMAVLAGVSVFAAGLMPQTAPWVFAFPILVGLPAIAPRFRAAFVGFGLALALVGFTLVVLRAQFGLGVLLWLLGIVVVSDVLGYFAGRMIGGPRFWPRISPKKTWSGTIAGWIGAVVVAILAWACGVGGWALLLVSPLVAFAGQMGDIAESWLKRRVGVKDSSNLIPGHGGFMDRFDALSGAVLMVGLLDLMGWLPIGA